MPRRVAIVYNEPQPSGYDARGEEKAVLGVLEAVTAVNDAARELGYSAEVLPLVPPFEEARKKLAVLNTDVVFNLFEGFCGEPETEALVPETLTELGIPFTGCQAPVIRLALDKAGLKKILNEQGIPTPDFQVISPQTLDTFRLKFPCIVKPRAEDASHGISADSLVTDFASLEKQVKAITATYHSGSLVEQFLTGREFNATVMGNVRCVVLPVSEIVYELPPGMPRILTFAAKWEPESDYFKGTKVICPAEVTAEIGKYIAETAKRGFRAVVGQGYARMDMRMDADGNLNIMEINPNPDISPDTGAARQSKAAGMTYAEFIEKIVNMALEKNKYGRKSPPDARRRQTGVDENTGKYARI
jgi:D-alanine-D-alanine ligase